MKSKKLVNFFQFDKKKYKFKKIQKNHTERFVKTLMVTLKKNIGFSENPTALTTFEQSPTQHHFFVATLFFQLTPRLFQMMFQCYTYQYLFPQTR